MVRGAEVAVLLVTVFSQAGGVVVFPAHEVTMNFSPHLNYVYWANKKMLDMLRACPQVESKSWALFAHTLASEHLWLCRLQGRAPDIAVWPELGPDECEKMIEMNFSGYREYLKSCTPAVLSSTIDYHTTNGEHHQTHVSDVLSHILSHGAYHRGQIASAVKRSGGEVVNTDYISFVREKH